MVVVSERIEEEVPPEYAELLGITTLVCTPLSAAGRAYGVICADRGGGTVRALRRRARTCCGRWGRRPRSSPPRGTSPASRSARGTSQSGSSSRGRCTSGYSSACSACRSRSAPSSRSTRPSGSAARPRCTRRSRTCAARSSGRWRRCRRRRRRPSPRSSSGCASRPGWRSRSTGAATSRCPSTSSRSPSRCSRRRYATPPSTPNPRRVEVAVARDADSFTLEVRNDGVKDRRRSRTGAAGWGCGSPRSRRSSTEGPSRRGRSGEGSWRVRLVVALGAGAEVTPAATREQVRLRVLVVDDHDVVHWGFRVLLAEQPWVERCLAARTADEALALTQDVQAARRAGRSVPGP